ncbi:sigma factor [Saccharothrix carnea]|uniref:sigma factor n=1 Tax=Saccharothrix carnea TaxID=1280637 RepID=UPI003CCBB7BE
MSDGVAGSEVRVPSARDAARRDDAACRSPDGHLAAAGRGDVGAFGLFYDHVGGLVFGLVRAVVRDPATAEVLVHDIFLESWRTAGRFSPAHDDAVRWVTTLAHRRAVGFVRSTRSDTGHGAPDADICLLPSPVGLADTPSMSEERSSSPRSGSVDRVAARGGAAGLFRGKDVPRGR